MGEDMRYALQCIIGYDGHYEWLERMADEIEKAETIYSCPFGVSDWHTEEHTIWMLLVGMFGEWGTSIRGGWIDKKEEAVKFIREICKEAKGEEDED